MENPNPPTFEQSIKVLAHNDYFKAVVFDLLERRESAIKELSTYKDDSGLRKAAAEVTVFTDLLDAYGVPVGVPV
jgi:hypothetical protein